ncbi:HMG-box domain-containing protein [Streptomyces vinaceus]|uniref:hypothetical protein n=1 Tax=Streptomyces vinaceus TaxID=1960 RepID=UPI003817ABBD
MPIEKKSKRSPRDPNRQKRALSPYTLFAKEQTRRVVAEEPNLSFGEIGQRVGATWQKMNAEQRREWVDKAAQLSRY